MDDIDFVEIYALELKIFRLIFGEKNAFKINVMSINFYYLHNFFPPLILH